MAKPRVNLVNPIEKHSGPNERVIEVVADGNVALILFAHRQDGGLEVYPYDKEGEVRLTLPLPSQGYVIGDQS